NTETQNRGSREGGGGGGRGGPPNPTLGQPKPPQQSTKLATIGLQSRAARFGVKVVLIPKPVLLLRRRRFNRPGDVVNVVAVGGDEAECALRPERGDDEGGATAQIHTDEHCGPALERV